MASVQIKIDIWRVYELIWIVFEITLFQILLIPSHQVKSEPLQINPDFNVLC